MPKEHRPVPESDKVAGTLPTEWENEVISTWPGPQDVSEPESLLEDGGNPIPEISVTASEHSKARLQAAIDLLYQNMLQEISQNIEAGHSICYFQKPIHPAVINKLKEEGFDVHTVNTYDRRITPYLHIVRL